MQWHCMGIADGDWGCFNGYFYATLFHIGSANEDSFVEPMWNKVIHLGNDTFGNPIFRKVKMKLVILSDYKCPRMLCLALPPHRKVQKLDFQSEFSMSKIIQIFIILFSLKNKNPSIYNIICWFAGPMGQTTRRQSVWCFKYYFFFIKSCKILCENPFNFFFNFFIKLQK